MSTTPLSDADRGLASFAIGLELAARDLYQAVIDAGGESEAWPILRDQHAEYAQRIGGVTGMPANARNEDLYGQYEAAFGGDRPVNAGFELENIAAATHIELLASITDTALLEAIAAVVAMESRHAAYLGQQSGRGEDFDALFVNNATPITPEATS